MPPDVAFRRSLWGCNLLCNFAADDCGRIRHDTGRARKWSPHRLGRFGQGSRFRPLESSDLGPSESGSGEFGLGAPEDPGGSLALPTQRIVNRVLGLTLGRPDRIFH